QRVLRLRQDADQVLPLQGVQRRNDGQAAHQLGDDAELQQVVGLNLLEDSPHVPVLLALELGVEADAPLVGAPLDDLLQAVKSAAADEEDVPGVDLDELLVGMLSAALRGNVGHGALQD